MGAEESSISTEGVLERQADEAASVAMPGGLGPTERVLCEDCDVPATYRCKIKVDDLSEVRDYPDLMDYWVPQTRNVRGKYIVSYVGCQNCVTDKVKDIFTHKPEGWMETICMEDDYEDAKV